MPKNDAAISNQPHPILFRHRHLTTIATKPICHIHKVDDRVLHGFYIGEMLLLLIDLAKLRRILRPLASLSVHAQQCRNGMEPELRIATEWIARIIPTDDGNGREGRREEEEKKMGEGHKNAANRMPIQFAGKATLGIGRTSIPALHSLVTCTNMAHHPMHTVRVQQLALLQSFQCCLHRWLHSCTILTPIQAVRQF